MRAKFFANASRGDFGPSKLSKRLAVFGAVMELAIPLLLAAGALGPSSDADDAGGSHDAPRELQRIGLLLAIGMHLFIVVSMPVGSVTEWNMFNIVASCLIFGGQRTQGLGRLAVWSPALALFVATTQFGLPLAANLPGVIHFFSHHFALRKYTGNHPYHTFMIEKASIDKLKAVPVWNLDAFREYELPPKPSPELHTKPAVMGEDETIRPSVWSLKDPFTAEFLRVAALAMVSRCRLNTQVLVPELLPRALPAGRSFREYALLDSRVLLGQTMYDTQMVSPTVLSHLQHRCRFAPGQLVRTMTSTSFVDF